MNVDIFEKDFLQYLKEKELIKGGEKIIVGLSGGADSVALLALLANVREILDTTLVAVHIHHGIRGQEADRDARFSEEFAKKINVSFICKMVDAPGYAKNEGLTLEEAARVLRYRALEEVCESEDADLIALAHHKDDQAETVLMNLLRGTGAAGLSGIRPKNGNRIRPLLFATKKEILGYLDMAGYEHVEDSTNQSSEHSRNRIRTEIMPIAEELYPGATDHIAALAEDMLVFRESAEKKAKAIVNDNRIIISEYKKQDDVTKHEMIKIALSAVIPGSKDVTRVHYTEIKNLIEGDGNTGKSVSLPLGVKAIRSYDELVIKKDDSSGVEITETELVIPGKTTVENNGKSWAFETEIIDAKEFNLKFERKDYTKHIKYDRIDGKIVLRNPREGDYLEIGRKGDKKLLSRYYIDSKVARDERPKQLVLSTGSLVVCALPERLSDTFKIDESTKRVLQIKWTVGEVAYEGNHS